MKHKSLILIVPCATLTLISNATAVNIGSGSGEIGTILSCTKIACPTDTITYEHIIQPFNDNICHPGTMECYAQSDGKTFYTYKPCQSCASPYTKTKIAVSECGMFNAIFDSCECKCDNCTSDDWTNYSTGYQRRAIRNCDCSGSSAICKTTYSYRCTTGYYGSSTNGTSGCNPCPTWSGVYTTSAKTTLVRGTSATDTTAITGCYVVPGTYYDITGTFNTSGNCKY